jgi:hypothetical protein
MGFFRWIDRNLWSVPVIAFLMAELALGLWSAVSSKPILLAAAPATSRQAIYSSLTGSSSALLGLALAAVAILVAFTPRPGRTGPVDPPERALGRARLIIVGSLLAASFFMLVLVIVATIAIGVDVKPDGNVAITTLIEASGLASVVGLLVGGFGLVLAIAERSRQ